MLALRLRLVDCSVGLLELRGEPWLLLGIGLRLPLRLLLVFGGELGVVLLVHRDVMEDALVDGGVLEESKD